MERRVIISGCSGGGKSTVLRELSRRGYRTVEEAGRQIVAEALDTDPDLLPWNDLAAFAKRAIEIAHYDMVSHLGSKEWVFFDRGLVDAVTALRFAGEDSSLDLGHANLRHASEAFFAPPWEAIYERDDVRQHDFAAGVEEADRLDLAYRDLGYHVRYLPKVSVAERADWIERELGIR